MQNTLTCCAVAATIAAAVCLSGIQPSSTLEEKKITDDTYDFQCDVLCDGCNTVHTFTGEGAGCVEARSNSGVDEFISACAMSGCFPVETNTSCQKRSSIQKSSNPPEETLSLWGNKEENPDNTVAATNKEEALKKYNEYFPPEADKIYKLENYPIKVHVYRGIQMNSSKLEDATNFVEYVSISATETDPPKTEANYYWMRWYKDDGSEVEKSLEYYVVHTGNSTTKNPRQKRFIATLKGEGEKPKLTATLYSFVPLGRGTGTKAAKDAVASRAARIFSLRLNEFVEPTSVMVTPKNKPENKPENKPMKN